MQLEYNAIAIAMYCFAFCGKHCVEMLFPCLGLHTYVAINIMGGFSQ